MAFSNSLENKSLVWALTAGEVTRPSAWYVALSTTNPQEDGSGISEPSGNGYVRKAVTFSVSGNVASNSAIVTFPTATGSWGTITHVAVYDALEGGNLLAYGALGSSVAVATNTVPTFAVSTIQVSID